MFLYTQCVRYVVVATYFRFRSLFVFASLLFIIMVFVCAIETTPAHGIVNSFVIVAFVSIVEFTLWRIAKI